MKDKIRVIDWILIEATLDNILVDKDYEEGFDWFKSLGMGIDL